MSPNSTLKWLLLEGVTEYLALQSVRDLLGETSYYERIKQYASSVKNKADFKLLSQVNTASEIDEEYRYLYAPMLFTALERNVGRDKMWNLMKVLLSGNNIETNYEFFKASLLEASIDVVVFETIEKNLLEDPNSLNGIFQSTK